MRAVGNYYAYVDTAYNAVGPNSGFASADGWFVQNTVLVGGGTFSYFGYGYSSDCFMLGHQQFDSSNISHNAVHSALPIMVPCLDTTAPAKGCLVSCPLEKWLAGGHDPGTTIGPLLPDEEVIAAARLLLGML